MLGVSFFARAPCFIFWRCCGIGKGELQINGEIRDKEVRLVGSDGYQFGVVPLSEALDKAAEYGVDLVKIAPKATPPVCKIIDYGKYKFDKMKKEKESRKNRKVTGVKEIRLSVSIDVHDFETKVGHAKKFVASGNKVKVTLRFKGREIGHAELGRKVLNDFSVACDEFASTEKFPKLEGRSMTMFLAPKVRS